MRTARPGYVTLIAVLLIGTVGSAIALSILVLSIGAGRNSLLDEQSAAARALADSCIEEAMRMIDGTTNFAGSGSLTFGLGSCSYTVVKLTGANRSITSTGTVGTVVRKVTASIDKINPNIHLTSWQEVADF